MPNDLAHNKAVERGREMYALYRKGQTMQKIGDRYNLSRERVRQLIEKAIVSEISTEKISKKDITTRRKLKVTVHKIIGKHRSGRTEKEVKRLLAEKYPLGARPEIFFSTIAFAKLIGISLKQLEKYRPDIIETILNNKRKRWSRYYAQCRICGTTTVKHRSHGICRACYYKSPEWALLNEIARERAAEKKYSGNRELAIQKYQGKCANCGIERELSRSQYGKDLCVIRVNRVKDDNNIDNLKPLCPKCFLQWKESFGWQRWNRGGRRR